ncbi:MAG: hypothetical protein IK019_07560 [Clostridia bacterium]|nr:hypothetical protein [Clostridia bacterium]
MRQKNRDRYIVLCVILALFAVAITIRLYSMQIVHTDDYTAQVEKKSTKTIRLYGMRGTIYDKNMIPLAYDQSSYNIQFYRDPSRSSDADRAAYTQSIYQTILLIESNGKSTLDPATEFWLRRNEYGQWEWNLGTDSEVVAETRETQWRGNFSLSSKTRYPVDVLFETLCHNYSIPSDLSEEYQLKILAIWQASRMNNYNSTPVTIAYDVGFETVAEVEVRALELEGMSVQESSTRVYPFDTVACHAIGYVSRITTSDALENYRSQGYPTDAHVGATGLEYSMEDQLSPYLAYRQGERVVEINTKGAVVREISYSAPTDGNSVVTTIDTSLQAVMEKALADVIADINQKQTQILYAQTTEGVRWNQRKAATLAMYAENGYEISLAQTGAMVAMDPNSGRILGMVSHPSFDLSIFEGASVDPGGWSAIAADPRNPMFNRAISAKDTPGSIFKLVTSLGGLTEGAISITERISDGGDFVREGTDTSRAPKCWIGESKRYLHANQTIVEAIKNSCNYFFYEVSYRLGSTNLTKWAAALGLTTKTNIELPSEATGFVGNQSMLYDPDRSVEDQYTYKPQIAASMIKRLLQQVAADRGVEYDAQFLEDIAIDFLNIVITYETKAEWLPAIRDILLYDCKIPSNYISSHFMVNTINTYLNDLKWTPAETIMVGIGQSITQVTPIAVARYVAAIANNGTVYDAQIVDKVIDANGNVVLEKHPVVANRIVTSQAYFDAIHKGMEEVTSTENDGTAAEQFSKSKYKIAAKTGTSQRTQLDLENNSWLVTYAPIDDPQIVVVVYIQNGYAGAYASQAAITTIEYYLDSLNYTEKNTIVADNSLAD